MGEGKKFAAIFGLNFALWTPVLLGSRAACRITTAQLANQELALPAIMVDMLRFLPSALVYALVIGVPVMMASSCFFIPGLLIASLFTLVVPVSVNETAGIFPALRRNFSLVSKVFGGLFLITLLCAVVIAGVIALRVVTIDHWLPAAGIASLGLRLRHSLCTRAAPGGPGECGIYADLFCGPALGKSYDVFCRFRTMK